MNETLRGLPAVHRLLDDPSIARYAQTLGPDAAKRAIGEALDLARASAPQPSSEQIRQMIRDALEHLRRETLVAAVNATGILLHTNLGRAPLSTQAREAASAIGAGYSNLEYDVERGARGSRYGHVRSLLCELSGAQDAVVVNNCAAAVFLAADTLGRGRETIVSRNQLIEIGGGFRLPDVLARSGSDLVEVGTTNKVRLRDFTRAFTPRTGLVLRSHPSNFSIQGFTEDVAPRELADACRSAGVVVFEDLGGGALVDLREYGLPRERTVPEAVADGADLVAFSGDKLLGGPQAGILVGSRAIISRLRANPLIRALRVDKQTLAALGETLRAYTSPERVKTLPLYRMLSIPMGEMRARAQRYVSALGAAARGIETTAYVGGGSLPQERLPSFGVAYRCARGPDAATAALRRGDPPIVARIEHGEVIVDLRTVAPEDDEIVIRALVQLT